MTRLLALILGLVLVTGPAAATPRTAATMLPPESSLVNLAPETPVLPAATTLRRLGTLRIAAIGLWVNVYDWGCRGSIVPNLALRWGCRSSINQYIAGHAYGVFHPYYLAYTRHRLVRGMVATFTTPAGRVTRYRLAWVRFVPRTYLWHGMTGEQWAWGATSTAALTLQTCWGATNAYRIVTRFVKG